MGDPDGPRGWTPYNGIGDASRLRGGGCILHCVSIRPAHAIACLKEHGLQSVWMIQRPGQPPRTIKTWPLGPLMLLKLAVGGAQPQRQFRGERRLRQAGVATPGTCGRWRFSRRGWRPVVEVEMGFVPGQPAGDLVMSAPGSAGLDDETILKAASDLGAIIARLIQSRLFHRDMKLINVIVDEQRPRPRLWLIDAVDVRPMRKTPAQVERMLERIGMYPIRIAPRLAGAMRIRMLLSALRPLSRMERREVFRLMRARRRRESARSSTGAGDRQPPAPRAGTARPPPSARAAR
jgi:hypothetical protein